MEQRYKALLESKDDQSLFLNGGCHVFALALHERFNYSLVRVMENASKAIPHVFCRIGAFAVDVMGFNIEQNILVAQSWTPRDGYSANEATPSELEERYIFDPPSHGLYGNKDFLAEARNRAIKRIDNHLRFFDGTCRLSIKPHPFLKDKTAGGLSVFEP